jgi:hypothetical protein
MYDAKYINRVRSGLRTKSNSGTIATHAKGPKSTGVKLAHKSTAETNDTANAPRDFARIGALRAAAMISSTVISPDLGLAGDLTEEIFAEDAAEETGMVLSDISSSILGLKGAKRIAEGVW